MKKIKYTIASGTGKTEGVLMVDTIAGLSPGDRDGTAYIQLTTGKIIKVGNTVAELDKRIDAAVQADDVAIPVPIINIPAPATPTVNLSGTTFKALLQNRRVLYINLTDAASKAKLAELDLLITLV